MKNLEALCQQIATEAHTGQKRNDGKDYITHPAAVAAALSGGQEKCIAWLHDVLEDTEMTEDDLHKWGVPQSITRHVLHMTRIKDQEYKKDYIQGVISKCSTCTTIKIADVTHNLSTLEGMPNHVSLRERYEWTLEFLSHF